MRLIRNIRRGTKLTLTLRLYVSDESEIDGKVILAGLKQKLVAQIIYIQ